MGISKEKTPKDSSDAITPKDSFDAIINKTKAKRANGPSKFIARLAIEHDISGGIAITKKSKKKLENEILKEIRQIHDKNPYNRKIDGKLKNQ